MTKNEELLTVTNENEEKLRALVEKAKTWAPKLFQRHYKITPEEFEKKEYTRTCTYRAFEEGVIEGHIGVALDLDCDDEKLSSLILNMRTELKNREEERDEKKDDESKNEYSMRQIIIARKDLNMSAGKLAAQCCHASEAFLAHIIENGQCIAENGTADDIVDAQIEEIAGFPIDHAFLRYKKELLEYGYEVAKISMKQQTVEFKKLL